MKFILIVLTSFVFFIFSSKETPNVSIIPTKEVVMPPLDCGTPTMYALMDPVFGLNCM